MLDLSTNIQLRYHVTKDYETEILCLTKTQISLGHNTEKIEEYLPKFYFFHNKSNDKYQILVFCARDSVEIDTLSQGPGGSSFLAYKALIDFPLKFYFCIIKTMEF